MIHGCPRWSLGPSGAGDAAWHVPLPPLRTPSIVVGHPANIGGFYGFLVAGLGPALRLGTAARVGRSVAVPRIVDDHGLCSKRLCFGRTHRFSKRHPVAPPRQILYPMPFVGLAFLTIDHVDMFAIPSAVIWALLLLPSPMYVHLSWAPRWRLLCILKTAKTPSLGWSQNLRKRLRPRKGDGDTEMLGSGRRL